MALYTISDLHLPLGVDKPMDIFGKNWENYVERLQDNWQNVVKPEDTVVLPGDFSWAMYLDEAEKDFEFLHSLNGKKIILKGNHDYWWETLTKLRRYVAKREYDDIYFLQNNYFEYNDKAICGTRGWNLPVSPHMSDEDKKIYEREVQRLELSLSAAPEESEKIVFTHFPPVGVGCTENKFTDMMKKYGVKKCIYGHLHAKSADRALRGNVSGIDYLLVSCDYLRFMPVKLFE